MNNNHLTYINLNGLSPAQIAAIAREVVAADERRAQRRNGR